MVFSSHLFLFWFLPLTLALYYALPRRGRNAFLTGASYIFYGWANPLFVVLMFVSTVIDYLAGLLISGQWRRSAWHAPVVALEPGGPRSPLQRAGLVASIVSNLSLLGFFKYFNFAVGSWDALAVAAGMPDLQLDTALRVVLPLGISFYTFQSMSYTIDVYRGHARAIRNFTDFSCFVAMFPQLVAGPIIRFSEIAQQLVTRRETIEKFARGVAFLSLGLAKKVLLANPCGKIADTVFDAAGTGVLDAWYGITAYAFQIYFDFSGYSDMAIGLGLMMGFVFAKNFDSPYHSASITEFWRRWHISLSSWLRDYLYVPLGGNRLGARRTYLNLAVVMLLGGLWHGAAWTFVTWGAIHGGLLAAERAFGKRPFYHALPRPLRVAATFVLVLFAWVFFRSPDFATAFAYCRSLLGLGAAVPDGARLIDGLVYSPLYLGAWLAAAAVTWGGVQTWDWTRRLTPARIAVVVVLFVVSVAVLTTQAYNPFIYFIF